MDRRLVYSLQKLPDERSQQDLHIIASYLYSIEGLNHLREPSLLRLAKAAHYEYYDGSVVLWREGDLCTCWYILLAGSVFIDGSMFLPRNSFGKPNSANGRRTNDCLILEPSEMIVINQRHMAVGGRPAPSQTAHHHTIEPGPLNQHRRSHSATNLERLALDQVAHSSSLVPWGYIAPHELPTGGDQHTQHGASGSQPMMRSNSASSETAYKRSSRASDTSSSIYSGDGDGPSLHDSSLVDSDDDGDYGAESTLTVVDSARESLEKNPDMRTDDDIEILLEFLQNLPAFANMTMAIRRALCAVMVYAVVEKAGTAVMNDGEELDSWSVILNGQVMITSNDGSSITLGMGDSFGIKPTKEKEYHKGVMTTMVDDCQFVCIAQDNYYDILSEGEENTTKVEENGVVVLVTENRTIDNGARRGDIVIRGTPERLIRHLIEDRSHVDMTYDEDFLLTYRQFLKSPLQIANELLEWFEDEEHRERVTRVVLLWVNNHFNDFESDMDMTEFLQLFEEALERKSMLAHLRFLHIACAAKARPRAVTLTRGTRDEILHFSILGGVDQNCGIFISNVEKQSKAYEGGLKRGDQILEVNNTNFENISHSRALDVLRGTTLLSITVKSNLLAFRDMLNKSEKLEGAYAVRTAKSLIKITNKVHDDADGPEGYQPIIGNRKKSSAGNKTRFMKVLAKMSLLPKTSTVRLPNADTTDGGSAMRPRSNSLNNGNTLTRSNSSPDVAQASYGMDDSRLDIPDQVLKIYRADQTYKFFLIHKDTTAREVVMLALRQFGISEHSNAAVTGNITCSNYSLCEVSVEHGGLVKQKRLPDTACNLSDKIGVRSRYYLRNNMSTETLVPDDAVQDLEKETYYTFLSLNPMEIAMQLTMNDYKVFQDIEPTEYVDNLTNRESRYGTAKLAKFENLVNREMFWVANVVCKESSVFRRMKCIKHFIKIAKYCKEYKNFNSMFAILSGLNTGTVSRLHNTWEKLPSKYQKMFDDLMGFLDPTRNMSKYRGLLSTASATPPVIPIFPIVKKDLTFVELGNDTKVEGLINFEKMRMIAKEVRHIVGLASAQYIQALMAPNNAMNSAGNFFANLNTGNMMSGVVTIRRKKRSSAMLGHPKKMFEEAQMSRRVRAYLADLTVIEDEEKLNEMSYQCEGNRKNESLTSAVSLTLPSPTPGPKFGANNPSNVNKLLSLSEKSRPVTHKPEKLTSPVPSHRPMSGGPAHGHSLKAVDLTADSSSVLGNMRGMTGALRKLSTSSSVSRSSTSSRDKYVISGSTHDDPDSGHCSMYDSHSVSSAASSQQPSPPSQDSQQQHATHPLLHRQNATPLIAGSRSGVKSLPDYQVAAQMAYMSRQQQTVPSSRMPEYYIEGRVGDEDLEEVVSAV